MKRRDALKLSLLVATGTLVSCNKEELVPQIKQQNIKVLPSNPQGVYENQVIILGAGISGLAAAQRLNAKNVKTIVLEGRDRIGGRIWTDKSLGFPFDMGAGWIHGPSDDNPVTTLAKNVSAKTFLTNDDSFSLFDRVGKEVGDTAFNSANQNYKNLKKQLSDYGKNLSGNDISVIEALEKLQSGSLSEPFIQWMMSSYLEFDKGGPIDNMSVKNFDTDEKFAGKDVLFPEGYEQILKILTA